MAARCGAPSSGRRTTTTTPAWSTMPWSAMPRTAARSSPTSPKAGSPNDDFSQWKVFLRDGMKWSDGEPFTADDIIVLVRERSLLNDRFDGDCAAVDAECRRLRRHGSRSWTTPPSSGLSASRTSAFLLALANKGRRRSSRSTTWPIAPTHYLKSVPSRLRRWPHELDAKVKAAGFQTWVELFRRRGAAAPEAAQPAEHRRLGRRQGSTVADEVFVIKRNPYYFAVGQPRATSSPMSTRCGSPSSPTRRRLNLAAIGGEIDMQGRHMSP